MTDTAPDGGKDELDELDAIVDHFSVHNPKGQAKGTLARRVLKKQLHSKVQALIAASNHRAVQKAQIEEAKHFERSISQIYAVNDKAIDEIKQFAGFRVEYLQRLAADRPRKDGDEDT